jgi:hypothetical protein
MVTKHKMASGANHQTRFDPNTPAVRPARAREQPPRRVGPTELAATGFALFRELRPPIRGVATPAIRRHLDLSKSCALSRATLQVRRDCKLLRLRIQGSRRIPFVETQFAGLIWRHGCIDK